MKAVSLTGLLAVTFGPPYSYTLLRAVYSARWAGTEAPFVLGCYTSYLLLLAVNGEWGGAGGRGRRTAVEGAGVGTACPEGGGLCAELALRRHLW